MSKFVIGFHRHKITPASKVTKVCRHSQFLYLSHQGQVAEFTNPTLSITALLVLQTESETNEQNIVSALEQLNMQWSR
jgi:hypothetical protein